MEDIHHPSKSADELLLVNNENDKSKYYLKIFQLSNIPVTNIENVRVTPASLDGQHFSSSIDYVTVTQDDGQILDLFVKRLGGKPENARVLKEMKLFDKEAGFFNIFLPDLNRFIVDDLKTNYRLDMLPKCYFANGELAVLENLAKRNYTVLDKAAGRHDLAHAKLVMKTYAKFHAPTLILIQEEYKCVKNFLAKYPFLDNPILYAKSVETYGDWVVSMFRMAENILKRNDDDKNCQYAIKIIGEFKEDLMSQMRSHYNPESGHLCFVVNHADGWNCNLMFQHKDDDKRGEPPPRDLILIDFQISNVASPNMDTSYYLFTSVQHQVRQKEWKNLLKIYYDTLTQNVNALNRTINFSFEDFLADYKRKFIPGFLYGVCLTVALDALADVGDLDKVEGNWMEHVCKVIDRWIQNNREKSVEVTQQLAAMFQEYRELTDEKLE